MLQAVLGSVLQQLWICGLYVLTGCDVNDRVSLTYIQFDSKAGTELFVSSILVSVSVSITCSVSVLSRFFFFVAFIGVGSLTMVDISIPQFITGKHLLRFPELQKRKLW
jgi:hypothetical protein